VLDFLPWEGKDFDPFELTRTGAPDAASAAVWDDADLGERCSGNCTCH
jgi:hypothetical protein